MKINDDEVLLCYRNDLNFCFQPNLVVELFNIVKRQSKHRGSKLKILFLGNGKDSNSVKQLARNTGSPEAFYFIHDDVDPVIDQVYNGCDFIIETNCLDSNRVQQYPYYLAEAMACGVIPISLEAGVLRNYPDSGFIPCYDGSAADAAERVLEIMAPEKRAFILNRQEEFLGELSAMPWELDVVLSCFKKSEQADDDLVHSNLKAVKANYPDSLSVHERVAMLDDRMKKHDLDDSETSSVLSEKGDLLIELQEIDDAHNSYELAVQLDDTNAAAYRGLGYIAFIRYANSEAVSFFKKSLGMNINDWRALFWMSLVHQRIGLYEDALYWLKKSIALGVKDKIVITALIQFCAECPSDDLARTTLEEAVETVGEDPNLMVALAQAYVRCGRTGIGAQIMNKYLPE